MNSGRTVFSQLIDHLPVHEFRKCVARYRGNHRTRTFSCWDQFLCLAFAQLTYRESLRDIVTCLKALKGRLYHLGIRGRVSRSTFSNANDRRDWRIYADFAQVLIHEARTLYAGEALGVELDSTVYALDATIIDLCMTLFPWAKFKSAQNAVKMHTLLDLRGNIPTFIRITPAKIHDVNFLDDLVPEAGAFYVMDRGYLDFERLYRWTRAGAFFVTRARKNFAFRRLYSHPADKTTGARCDQTIVLESFYPRQGYPAHLRRIAFYDADNDKRLVFLTNNFELNAKTIADLYRSRWQIELFFKWIKTAPADQGVLRYVGERGEDPDLERRVGLPARSDRAQASGYPGEPLHYSAGSERDALGENADFSGVFVGRLQNVGDSKS
jgi:hypothetical protein